MIKVTYLKHCTFTIDNKKFEVDYALLQDDNPSHKPSILKCTSDFADFLEPIYYDSMEDLRFDSHQRLAR